VQSSPRFWTANVEPFSKNCHDRAKPINHSTKLCLAGIVPSFCVRAECHGLLRRVALRATGKPSRPKIPSSTLTIVALVTVFMITASTYRE